MKKKIALISSSVLVLLLIVMALFAPWLAPNDPYATNMALKLQGFSTDYPLGTDYLGRCVLSRLLYGARVSLFIALSVLVVTLFISMFVGLLAGYVGGILDLVLMRLCDIFLAIPDFVFALVIVGALGGGIRNMFIAIVLVSWVGFARIIRNMVRSLKESTYVQYARTIGVPKWKIMIRHIVPFVFPQIFLLKLIGLGSTILLISELSFLGLGVSAPMAEWGMMISDSKTYLMSHPMLMFLPGIMISLTVLILNWFGDALREAMDPKAI
ncbi:Glutathione transport system permease protein GsiD [Lysinibacillus sphaericus]|uniref:Glutathione transport system permease protein GsiD n=1 Tax=Lysinibacillus sphaericus TaxID=1421 RepID=A0A2S5CZ14_LYSSH|nr:ABC transporter permease subunit [Lysinibacillus sphaericus]POZ56036.1 Glutathione transport system permease protein GsiD [Lysinibacillus sphaericus]